MLAARLGAWLRHTGERWAKAAFAEKLAVLLALGAVLYTIVTGAAELRYQARARGNSLVIIFKIKAFKCRK